MKVVGLMCVLLCLAACATPQDRMAAKCAEVRAKLTQLHATVEGARARMSEDEYKSLVAMEANATRGVSDACGGL